MKILLINPPSIPKKTVSRDAAGGLGTTHEGEALPVYPPMSIAYLAAILRDKGFSVGVYDANAFGHDKDTALQNIKKYSPDVIGSDTSLATFYNDATFLKEAKDLYGVYTFIFGPMVRIFSDEIMALSNADVGIIGEPEANIINITNGFEEQYSLSDVKGILYKAKDTVVKTSSELFVENLDSLPYPAWDVMPLEKYWYVTVQGSRGCPYKCIYCPYVVGQGGKFRGRTPQNIIDEINYLKEKFGMREILFRDPIFTFKRNRVIELCNLLKENDNIKWICETRPEHLDSELIKLMREAGCFRIQMGVESASPKILYSIKRLRKGQSAEEYLNHVREVIKGCKENSIEAYPFFVIGFPEENWDTIQETRGFIQSINPDSPHVSIATPFPETPFYAEIVSKGLLVTKDFTKFGVREAVVRTKYLSPHDLELARNEMLKDFDKSTLNSFKNKIKKNPFYTIELFKRFIQSKEKRKWIGVLFR